MPVEQRRITFDELKREFIRILLAEAYDPDRAALIARTFAENTRDGIHSHGINRFRQFVHQTRNGLIKKDAQPALVHSFGAFESWDADRGPGISSAHHSMQRAIELSHVHALGCVALRNTNHWMRGGTYGLQAADAGCVGICWTNAQAWMPPFGTSQAKLGNNPLVVAVPHQAGPLLLDMALSQFSVGRILIAKKSAELLPVPGGFDRSGNLTNDPAEILRTRCLLPIGNWKGSGLALLLDILASLFSTGRATYQISAEPAETGLSQVFLAIDLSRTANDSENGRQIVDAILADLSATIPLDPAAPVTAPGQRMLQRRQVALRDGILVDAEVWDEIRRM